MKGTPSPVWQPEVESVRMCILPHPETQRKNSSLKGNQMISEGNLFTNHRAPTKC